MKCFGFFKSKGKECLKCPLAVECWKTSIQKTYNIDPLEAVREWRLFLESIRDHLGDVFIPPTMSIGDVIDAFKALDNTIKKLKILEEKLRK